MNFLFLSKLIPLFVYPLGLSSLLLLLSLVLFWKRPHLTPFPVALALAILLISSNAWVSNALISSLESQITPPTNIPSADAIILLGGATKSPVPPRPLIEINEHGDRLFYAAELYHQKKAPVIIAAGGRIPWSGNRYPESADMSQLLQRLGVPSKDIIQEPNSLNTYQNAVNVQKILNNKNIERVLLVTSAFHMPRASLIFQKLGIESIPAPTDYFVTETELTGESFFLNFLPDARRLSITTLAIKEYIGMMIYRWRGWL